MSYALASGVVKVGKKDEEEENAHELSGEGVGTVM